MDKIFPEKINNYLELIRLNKPSYDATRFTKHGIKHHDLYFLDGSTPKK